jgi:RNA polymerase sigma-70 factor, ECF subfamily
MARPEDPAPAPSPDRAASAATSAMASAAGGAATASTDWAAVVDRVLGGDRLALAQLSRFVNALLARWNAYHFRDDWDDIVQEVVLAAALAVRDGRLRDRGAVAGYLRSTARFKFVDRLKASLRCSEGETLSWEEVVAGPLEPARPSAHELGRDLRAALERLPAKTRDALVAVYLEGRTYEEAASHTGVPLGSVKRYLREGLAQLRARLATRLDEAWGKEK